MTTPTAPLTTAAEMAREFFRIDPDAALTPAVERCIADLAALLTTYAAQIRRDTLEECAKWHESRAAACIENATKCHPAGAVYAMVMGTAQTHLEHAKSIRALPPGSPSSQTDTGDNNG